MANSQARPHDHLGISMKSNAGMRQFLVPDSVGPGPIPVVMFYPCDTKMAPQKVGPFAFTAARDGVPALVKAPLIVMSHGNSGSPWVHRDLAMGLAAMGAFVILPEHMGNSRSDNSLEGTRQNLINRPRQLKLCVEHLCRSEEFGPYITATHAIGHSIGGYTVLAAAGAKPYAGPHETQSGKAEEISVERTCFASMVLLAPATPWFQGADSLSGFDTPTLILTAELDDVTPEFHAGILSSRMQKPDLLTQKAIPGAGHFSFQSPFPPQMTHPQFPPSQDPSGFDRTVFQSELLVLVSQFLRLYP